MTARGQIARQTLGNGIASNYRYDAETGRLQNIQSANALYNRVQDLHYEWDTIGNLRERQDYSGNKTARETFNYDRLNRLTKVNSYSPNRNSTTHISYDLLGNITSKTGVGSYRYGAGNAGPHAITSVAGVTYSYDANGNNTSGGGRSLSYSTYDKVTRIVKSGHTTTFSYGPSRSRITRQDSDSNGNRKTTRYVGNVEVIDYTAGHRRGERDYKRSIAGIALETISYDASQTFKHQQTRYLHTDHLGSIDIITDTIGQVTESHSFDVWGKRRNASSWQPLLNPPLIAFGTITTNRGFTGHEMLDEVGIIQMNGRIYDPKLGRFLQADPHIQAPADTQMYNRYSYVRNNPLNATDPSGYFLEDLDRLGKKVGRSLIRAAVKIFGAEIVNLVGSAVSSYYGGAVGAALWSYEFSRAMGASSSQALRSAAITYVTMVVSYGVQDMNWASQALIKGFVGGVAAELQGGKFGHGFVSAGLSSLAGNIGPVDSGASIGNVDVGQVAVDAVVGGTISEVTGGKFANGARSAAYASILRQLTSPARVKKNEQDRETDNGPKSNEENLLDDSAEVPSSDFMLSEAGGDDIYDNMYDSLSVEGDAEILLASKGGKQNISAGGFNRKSNPEDVKRAMNEAKKNGQQKHYLKLKGILKVIDRGGRGLVIPIPSEILDQIMPEGVPTILDFDLDTPEGLEACFEMNFCV